MKTNLLALVAQIDLQEATSALPKDRVADGETVIGQLTDEHIRLWGVVEHQRKVAVELRASLKKDWDEPYLKHAAMHVEGGPDFLESEHPEHEALHKRLSELRAAFEALNERNEMLRDTFWNIVRLDLDIVDAQKIGIRNGGEVVTLPASVGHPLNGLLMGESFVIEIGPRSKLQSKPPRGFFKWLFGKKG